MNEMFNPKKLRVRRTPEQSARYHEEKMKLAQKKVKQAAASRDRRMESRVGAAFIGGAKDGMIAFSSGESGLKWIQSRLKPVMTEKELEELAAWWREKGWREQ